MPPKNPVPAPPTVDPSKLSVRTGDGAVITPGGPGVDIGIEGYIDGVPTAGIQPPKDPFVQQPQVTQPVAPQMFNWAQLSPVQLDAIKAMIQAQHPNVLWEKAALCPNVIANGDHNPACTICLHGMLFFDPQQVSMIVQAANLQQQFYIQGQFKSGSSLITALPENAISYGDRITIINNKVRTSDVRQRMKNSLIDKPKYPILTVQLLRTSTTTYKAGTDFDITKDGFIEWTKNKKRRPADGEWYTIVHTHRPVYIITDLVHQHRERRVKQGTSLDQTVVLPIQGLARLDFLVRDESKDAPEAKYTNPFSRV